MIRSRTIGTDQRSRDAHPCDERQRQVDTRSIFARGKGEQLSLRRPTSHFRRTSWAKAAACRLDPEGSEGRPMRRLAIRR